MNHMPTPKPVPVAIRIPSPAAGQPGIIATLDLSRQQLRLNMAERASSGQDYSFYPMISEIKEDISGFASSALLLAKAKQFDDGLMAAVEMLCQNGTENFCGKRKLLQQLADSLKSHVDGESINTEGLDACRSFIRAAAELGGVTIEESADIVNRAGELVLQFLGSDRQAKPISFYTWTEELGRIFQQDRFLQTSLRDLAIDLPTILATALADEPQTSRNYAAYVSLIRKLTNPYPEEYHDLTHMVDVDPAKKYCLFPPSRAVETEIGKKLFPGETAIPDNFSLIDQMVREIQTGDLQLAPTKESGWLDYQLWAREPLVVPDRMEESSHVQCGAFYKKKLLELFKSAVALLRETHIKNFDICELGSIGGMDDLYALPYIIRPQLSVEPTATYYRRQAMSYQFVRHVLEESFGEAALKKTMRLGPEGQASISLHEELADIESLFFGLYLLVMAEIGSPASIDQRDAAQQRKDIDHARNWLASYGSDPDLARDNRMMVPIFYDRERKKTKVWVMLGYNVSRLTISYNQTPEICALVDERSAPFSPALDQNIRDHIQFEGDSKWLVTPVTREIYVDRLLNRDEFRYLCDQVRSTPEIVKVLSGELTLEEVQEEADLATVYPYLMRCNELGGGYLTQEDGSFQLLSPDVARFLCCDDHYMVENKMADFLAALQLPGLIIGEPPVLYNRNLDKQYDTHKELFIANEYQRDASGKRELLQDNIWLGSYGIVVSASLQEKLTAAGFTYLRFRIDNWDG